MKLKTIIGAAGVVICLGAWIAMGVGLAMGVQGALRTGLVVAAAVSTELLFWCLAAILGLSVFEARRKVWAWIRGRPGPNQKTVETDKTAAPRSPNPESRS